MQKMKSEVNSNSSRSRLHSSQRGALLGPSYEGPKRGGGRYAKMEQEMQRSNQDFIRGELQDQQVGGACRMRGVCGWWVGPVCVVYHFCVDGSEATPTVVACGTFCTAQLSQKSILYNLCVCVLLLPLPLSVSPPMQQVMRQQDQDLEKVHHSLHTLGQMGEEIGGELDDQNRLAHYAVHRLWVIRSFHVIPAPTAPCMHGVMSTSCGNIV